MAFPDRQQALIVLDGDGLHGRLTHVWQTSETRLRPGFFMPEGMALGRGHCALCLLPDQRGRDLQPSLSMRAALRGSGVENFDGVAADALLASREQGEQGQFSAGGHCLDVRACGQGIGSGARGGT